jgi:uncharacterized protein YkwD
MRRGALLSLLGAAAASTALGAPPAGEPSRARPPRPVMAAPGAPASYGSEPDVTLTPAEARAAEGARARLAGGGAPPRLSGALVLAARELAQAAAQGAADPLARERVRAALSRALAYDPAPRSVVVEAPAAGAAQALAEALPGGRATHLGVGAAERGGSVVLVLLASERGARLAPFPRDVAVGASAPLSGALAAGLEHPRVFLTLPSGSVEEVKTRGAGGAFRAELRFPEVGRYTVEVVGDGRGGPEVAALFAVAAGGASLAAPQQKRSPPDPADDAAAEAAVVSAVNATRRRQGLPPLAPAPELAAVARRHSAAMAAQDRVAHVLPGSGDLGARLREASIPYARAYENVARASTALGAHETVEASPAHRENLLRPDAVRIGVGIARAERPPGDRAVYLTEVLVAPPDDGAESALQPEARVREALWRERQRLGLPPLASDPALDELARDAARTMHRRDAPEPDGLGERALALRRTLAAVDVFVASGPAEAIRSTNLGDRRFRRVGVGVTIGDSKRYGARRSWIAVVYTD